MGKFFSRLSRPLQKFNVENRAFKAIDREKRPKAPRLHRASAVPDQDVAGIKKHLAAKDEHLHDRLKDVYVTSANPSNDSEEDSGNRPLPQDRSEVKAPTFGYAEPKMIPTGRISLRLALEMLSRHQAQPTVWTANKLSSEYDLDAANASRITKYFQVFELYMPQSEKEFAAPAGRLAESMKALTLSELDKSGTKLLEEYRKRTDDVGEIERRVHYTSENPPQRSLDDTTGDMTDVASEDVKK